MPYAQARLCTSKTPPSLPLHPRTWLFLSLSFFPAHTLFSNNLVLPGSLRRCIYVTRNFYVTFPRICWEEIRVRTGVRMSYY
ncbi:hypothetical protein COCSADRAFT_275271 [Bipolaris sorokiniana ND90Pr]|uniref:Uncharacterized protein n=1 Tax=Cochliobolus sativus (strain ND90Pr / ATCC 201652) TaxID=665912 RepID=M2TIZ1_COCSN|nr:uncharacterized protein COCSADRAFT_275271 [Bipolaris sorokiniana ND90Pr]EMD68667.1 hypothetical protein COCSADRAFT_275271 [Bipolaris sorokiniana ND90Pr]